jgi:hypothetical protein
MKSDIGIFQELQSNGKVARSWIRYAATLLILMAFAYMFIQLQEIHQAREELWWMVTRKLITAEQYNIMKLDLPSFDWKNFLGLILLAIGGKVAQKYGEAEPTQTP